MFGLEFSLSQPKGREAGKMSSFWWKFGTAQEFPAGTRTYLNKTIRTSQPARPTRVKSKGKGLYDLQRCFLEAGAQRVIAALWLRKDTPVCKLRDDSFAAGMLTLNSS